MPVLDAFQKARLGELKGEEYKAFKQWVEDSKPEKGLDPKELAGRPFNP